MKAQRYISTLSLTSALDNVGQFRAPSALPPAKTRYPVYRRLGEPQGRSERVRRISPLPGFDPRTVQPVASRNTDCAIPARSLWLIPTCKASILETPSKDKLRFKTFLGVKNCISESRKCGSSIHNGANIRHLRHFHLCLKAVAIAFDGCLSEGTNWSLSRRRAWAKILLC